MFCTNCGNNLNGKNFCTQCGMQVKNNTNTNNQPKNTKGIFIIIGIVVVLGLLALLGLYGNDSNSNNNKSGDSRTIMIYMVGSDLESVNGLGTVDIHGIDGHKVDLNHNNVVLIAGGSNNWKNNLISANETSIFNLESSGFKKVLKQDIKNMGESESLSSFLNYVYNNYKTDKYDLVFWNHGAGVFGSEFDEIYGNDGLDLVEIKNALDNSPFKGNNKLESILFSTCLNSTLEMANALKDYSKYMIASEEVTKSFGLDSALSYINEVEATDTGIDVGKKAIDNYKNVITNGCKRFSTLATDNCTGNTYAIIDLSEIDELYTNVNDFFDDIGKNLAINYDVIAGVRSRAFQYAEQQQDTYDSVDLYTIVDGLKSLSPERAEKVLNSIKKAVKYNYTNLNESNGLSIYFPYNKNAMYMIAKYQKVASNTALSNFMLDFYQYKTTKQVSPGFNFSKSAITKGTKTNGSIKADLTLELTDEQLKEYAKAEYIMFVKEDGDYYRPIRRSSDIELNGNKLEAHVKGKQLRITDTSESESYWLLLGEKEITKDYTKYETGILLWKWLDRENFDFETINGTMEIMVDKKHPNGVISQVISNNRTIANDETRKKTLEALENKEYDNSNDSSTPTPTSKKVENINEFDTATFALGKYKILDENGNYKEDWESAGELRGLEMKPKEIKFVKEDFSKEYEYYCVFRIYDTAGNYHYSSLVKMD